MPFPGLKWQKHTHLFSDRDLSHAIGIRMAIHNSMKITQQYLSPQPRRDFKRLEQRRRQGMELFAQGVTQAEVARRCQVTETTSFRWKQAWIRLGSTAWRRRPLGRPTTNFNRPKRIPYHSLPQIEFATSPGCERKGN